MASMRTISRIALALLAVTPAAIEGQLAGFGGPLAQADMLYLAGEPLQAFEILDQHLATDSTDYDALWRAARAAVVLGIDAEGSRGQNAWLDPAMAFAERAVALRPDGIEGRYWRGVAVGRRAMNASPGYAVELAQVVYDDAHAILAADSTHGGAHNMLGKLNYEIMSLSRIKRGVARTFMGNSALDDTSWENARHHLERATEVWPDFVLFHFDLGQLHRRRGRREEAARSFMTALALEPVHPTDRKVQADARAYLEEWGLLTTQDSLSVNPDGAPRGR
jgi:tetratricopeptide (TPR) repeat protein